jgi:hypothetical protein
MPTQGLTPILEQFSPRRTHCVVAKERVVFSQTANTSGVEKDLRRKRQRRRGMYLFGSRVAGGMQNLPPRVSATAAAAVAKCRSSRGTHFPTLRPAFPVKSACCFSSILW